MQKLASQARATVEAALRHADFAVWMTTAPAAEHQGCCRDTRSNYSGHAHIRGVEASIGYCNHDAVMHNEYVARMLRASTQSDDRVHSPCHTHG